MKPTDLLRVFAVAAPLAIVACSNPDAGGTNGSEEDLTARGGESAPPFDLSAQRLCTVTAYSSEVEATKFAVGDFVVASVSGTTPAAIPLSKVVMMKDGKPSEARFALYLRRAGGGRSVMLTPYSPLPLASRDSTSLTFKSDSAFQDDTSMLKLSVVDAKTVAFDFVETVHGHPGRTMTLHCVQDDGPRDAGSD